MGLEEAGHAVGGAKNMPATCFLGRGRVPQLPDASRSGWGWKLHFPNIGKATLSGGLETVDKLSGAAAPKAPSDEGKRSAVAVVNDSPVDCQSRRPGSPQRAVSEAD